MLQTTRLHVFYDSEILSSPILSSNDTVFYLKSIWDIELLNVQEQVYMLYLNSKNEVICWRCLNTGCSTQTMIDIKFSAACAVGCLANKVIIAHNHPAGDLVPSLNDIRTTIKLQSAFLLLEIQLIDHIILSMAGYYSFKDKGQIKVA